MFVMSGDVISPDDLNLPDPAGSGGQPTPQRRPTPGASSIQDAVVKPPTPGDMALYGMTGPAGAFAGLVNSYDYARQQAQANQGGGAVFVPSQTGGSKGGPGPVGDGGTARAGVAGQSRENGVPTQGGTSTIDKMMQGFFGMEPKRQHQLAKRLWLAGYLSQSSPVAEQSLQAVAAGYSNLLQSSSAMLASGKRISPDALMQKAIQFRYGNKAANMGTDNLYKRALKGFGPGKGLLQDSTTVNKIVDMSSPTEAKAFLVSAMQQALGRDPSRAEIEDFTSMLNSHEEENPQLTRVTTHPSASGATRVTQNIVNNGFTSQESLDLAQRDARSAPNYAETQAAMTYLPALYQMLGSVV